VSRRATARRYPFATASIVALCTAAHAAALYLQLGTDAGIEPIIRDYALVPARVLGLAGRGELLASELYLPLLTSPFIHIDSWHLFWNMCFLLLIGRQVERQLGLLRYAAFYLCGAVVAGLTHVVANPVSVVPAVGASGGISAVLGAYFIVYPRVSVFGLRVPAPWLMLLVAWFALQLLGAALEVHRTPEPAVAWWAHLGGFVFGAAVVLCRGRVPRLAG
jgi:membrane associated rhomboid family serine protease